MSMKRRWRQICEQQKRIAERRFGYRLDFDFVLDLDDDYPNERDFAKTDGYSIYFSPKIRTASPEQVKGLVRHEIAHVIYIQQGVSHSETDADGLAEAIYQEPLYYDRQGIQTTEPQRDRTRPVHLPNPNE